MATITPSNHTRQRVEVPRAAPLQKDRMPPIANGTALRKPASASEGYGVTPNPTSLIDHTTSPAAHRPVETLISAQPSASLPCARLTAQAQAADAIAAATASPMSSIAVTARSPNQPLRRISAYVMDASATTSAATAKMRRRLSHEVHMLIDERS